MPISKIEKTCYYCERFYLFNCTNPKHNYCNQACKDEFTPNADWLYIEQLEKENEELKQKIEQMEKDELRMRNGW